MRHLSKLFIFLFIISSARAQQTVGLFQNDAGSYNGYTLFTPNTSTITYLIDNCGKLVHSWTSGQRPGMSVYLLEDGDYLERATLQAPYLNSGGAGGIIETLDWNSNVLWSYTLSSPEGRMHHDIEYLPNGNILAIVWDPRDSAEAIQAGRNAIPSGGVWAERIVELQPIGTDSAAIVWEWVVWDHLVQDFDNTKDNYGVVADHPELIDLNFVQGPPNNSDWLHFNSVDYNPDLDQIIISNHNFDEVWVIDHSTTTQEAASHSGGNSGKGGDLLYRWGNPMAYGAGTVNDQKLFGQHDAKWIEDGLPGAGKIMIYNNGVGRQPSYSTVDVIVPPVDGNGNYALSQGQAYGPGDVDWQYSASPNTDFYSSNISGAQRLANGNTIICEGSPGRFFEVDSLGNTVWEYVNPMSINGAISQGDVASQNAVFRCTRYSPDYAGLQGHTLTAGDVLEANPWPDNCSIVTSLSERWSQDFQFRLYPNPTSGHIWLEVSEAFANGAMVTISNMNGQIVSEYSLTNGEFIKMLDISEFPMGLYSLRFQSQHVVKSQMFSVVR